MRVSVFGIGYVGLVQAAVLAEMGHRVTCVDVDAAKVERLKEGMIPIFEPGLAPLVQANHQAGRLQFTSDVAQGVAFAELIFIAVGTPSRRGDGHADLRFVMAAAEEIGRAMTGYTVVVTKSTVPVGTNRKVADVIRTWPVKRIESEHGELTQAAVVKMTGQGLNTTAPGGAARTTAGCAAIAVISSSRTAWIGSIIQGSRRSAPLHESVVRPSPFLNRVASAVMRR